MRKGLDKDFQHLLDVIGKIYDERLAEFQTPGFVSTRCPNSMDHFITENMKDPSIGLTK
jgi:hypothetical protein